MYKKYNRFKKLKVKIINKEERKKMEEERKTPQNCKSPIQMRRFITIIKSVTEYTYPQIHP